VTLPTLGVRNPGTERTSYIMVANPVVDPSRAGPPATAHVRANPLVISLSLSKSTIKVGQTVQAKASVTNLGKVTLTTIDVELRVDPRAARLAPAHQSIARLKAGQSSMAMWSLCGGTPGTYVVLARATSAGSSVDSPAMLLTITAGSKKSC
jgi:hypothetical protein